MTETIRKVDSVEVTYSKSRPPILGVVAVGEVSTGGWKNPKLIAAVYVTPPLDGIQDFDFVADRLDGIVAQVISHLTAHYSHPCADWVKGVRVHARTNAIEENI